MTGSLGMTATLQEPAGSAVSTCHVFLLVPSVCCGACMCWLKPCRPLWQLCLPTHLLRSLHQVLPVGSWTTPYVSLLCISLLRARWLQQGFRFAGGPGFALQNDTTRSVPTAPIKSPAYPAPAIQLADGPDHSTTSSPANTVTARSLASSTAIKLQPCPAPVNPLSDGTSINTSNTITTPHNPPGNNSNASCNLLGNTSNTPRNLPSSHTTTTPHNLPGNTSNAPRNLAGNTAIKLPACPPPANRVPTALPVSTPYQPHPVLSQIGNCQVTSLTPARNSSGRPSAAATGVSQAPQRSAGTGANRASTPRDIVPGQTAQVATAAIPILQPASTSGVSKRARTASAGAENRAVQKNDCAALAPSGAVVPDAGGCGNKKQRSSTSWAASLLESCTDD